MQSQDEYLEVLQYTSIYIQPNIRPGIGSNIRPDIGSYSRPDTGYLTRPDIEFDAGCDFFSSNLARLSIHSSSSLYCVASSKTALHTGTGKGRGGGGDKEAMHRVNCDLTYKIS